MHRSRICYVTIDCLDLRQQTAFWAAALGVEVDDINPNSADIYARLRGGLGDVTLLFQKVPERKSVKNRVHLDIETDDVEAEVSRLEALGARPLEKQEERGFWFWVLADPEGNEFCVLNVEYPDLLRRHGRAWGDGQD